MPKQTNIVALYFNLDPIAHGTYMEKCCPNGSKPKLSVVAGQKWEQEHQSSQGLQSIYCCKDLCHFSAQILPHLEPSVSSDIIFCKIHTSEASRARYNGMRKTVDFGVSQKKCVQIPPVSLDSHQTVSSLVKQRFISLLHSDITWDNVGK